MPLQIPNAKEKEVKAPAASTAKVSAVETKEDITGKVFGNLRAGLSFVRPLGDPSNPDTTTVKTADGSEDKKVTSTIVGYKFEVIADKLMVPACGTTEKFKKDPMDFANIDNWEEKKKGDIVALTPFETALLLSQDSFNGGCDGGTKPVSCVYQLKTLRDNKGATVVASANTQIPRVSLRAASGSIKDFEIEDVLTFVKKEENGVSRKVRTIVAGFEKWAPLCAQVTRVAGSGSSTKTDDASVVNKNAQAFLAYVNAKKVQK